MNNKGGLLSHIFCKNVYFWKAHDKCINIQITDFIMVYFIYFRSAKGMKCFNFILKHEDLKRFGIIQCPRFGIIQFPRFDIIQFPRFDIIEKIWHRWSFISLCCARTCCSGQEDLPLQQKCIFIYIIILLNLRFKQFSTSIIQKWSNWVRKTVSAKCIFFMRVGNKINESSETNSLFHVCHCLPKE